jgi:purine-binding chemotaxis protein CheW
MSCVRSSRNPATRPFDPPCTGGAPAPTAPCRRSTATTDFTPTSSSEFSHEFHHFHRHESRRQYLTVVVDQEAYGIGVLKVREIIRLQKITPVPQMPEYVKGVINLRGRMIPVIDLRLKFGLKAKLTERTCAVVVQVKLPTEQVVPMGLIVDSVEDVVTLTDDKIEPTPEFGVRVDTSNLLGIAKINGQVETLLDIDRVVAPETVQLIAAQAVGT